MREPETYRVYAVKYAVHDRKAQANFIQPVDFHDDDMPLDYFVWALVSDARTIVVDTGFDQAAADRRGRSLLRCPGEGLRMVGVEPGEVQDVIVTHMHYDHAGNVGLFPQATFHLQEREMVFATGKYMRHKAQRYSFDPDDVCDMVRKVYGERVRFHDGDAELFPGVSVHLIGGHTMGLQSVRVFTERGWVMLASDAMHLYANPATGNPYPTVFNVGDMVEGWDRVRALADSEDHIVPGHDPGVMRRYPPAGDGLDGIAVRLDLAPVPAGT